MNIKNIGCLKYLACFICKVNIIVQENDGIFKLGCLFLYAWPRDDNSTIESLKNTLKCVVHRVISSNRSHIVKLPVTRVSLLILTEKKSAET